MFVSCRITDIRPNWRFDVRYDNGDIEERVGGEWIRKAKPEVKAKKPKKTTAKAKSASTTQSGDDTASSTSSKRKAQSQPSEDTPPKQRPAPDTDADTEHTSLLPEPLKSNEKQLNEAIASAPRVKGQPAITINRVLRKQATALGLKTAQYELARKYVKIASGLGSNPAVTDLRAAFQLDKEGLESRREERSKQAQRARRMQENSSMRRHRLARESAEKSFDAATDAQLQRIADADLSVFSEFEIAADTSRRTGPPRRMIAGPRKP